MKNLLITTLLITSIQPAMAMKWMFSDKLESASERLNQNLFSAAQSGDYVRINACLEEGANLNARDEKGWTPLMHAAHQANDEACTFLIDRGADMTALNAQGESVWVVATKDIYRQRVPLILIAKGLNIQNVKLKPFIEVGNAPICRSLVEHGSPVTTEDIQYALTLREKNEILEVLIKNGFGFAQRNKYGKTLFMQAARANEIAACMFMIETQKKINTRALALLVCLNRMRKEIKCIGPIYRNYKDLILPHMHYQSISQLLNMRDNDGKRACDHNWRAPNPETVDENFLDNFEPSPNKGSKSLISCTIQ